MSKPLDDYILYVGPCASVSPIKDDDDADILCVNEKFHKGTHKGILSVERQEFVTWEDIIEITGNFLNKEGCSVACSCGWSEGPSVILGELGKAAFKHRNETDHKLRGL